MDSELGFKLFDEGKYMEARVVWEKSLELAGDDTTRENYLFNIATCHASEGNFHQAITSLKQLKNQDSDVLYNLTLCNYKLGHYKESKSLICEVIDSILVKSSDFSASNQHQNLQLCDNLMIKSFNLKAAILYKLEENCTESLECLRKNLVKNLDQLDCVSLHNMSIYESQIAPEESLKKLEHLVELMKDNEFSGSVPSETIGNLLMLYIYGGSSERANLLMHNEASLISKNMDHDILNYFRCFIEARRAQISIERLDRLSQVLIKNGMEKSPLVDIIVSQIAFLLWDSESFDELEEYLLKTKQYTKNLDAWSENMAHTLFMQDTRYEECTTIYEEMMMSHTQLSKVSPIILCNLCISYILSGKNNDAEGLIKKLETTEIEGMEDSDCQTHNSDLTATTLELHCSYSNLTLINLAIGTLYCVKCNYQFGLSRIIKTLTPVDEKLTPDTWFIAKRCILSLLSNQCRQIVCVQDQLFDELIRFLMQCERAFGHSLAIPMQPTSNGIDDNQKSFPASSQNHPTIVTTEARLLRFIVVKIFHD